MMREIGSQFGLRIALGLVLLLATRDVLAAFPPVSFLASQMIIGVMAVGLPALFLSLFDDRRRA